jgi:small subunit ribosomal protein S17e
VARCVLTPRPVLPCSSQASKTIIENYYGRLTQDFNTNKRVVEEVAIIPTKRLRNKIAGFTTHVMKRIQRGPVRGISLKLQEEERERRMDFVPEQSAINTETIEVDRDSMDMLRALNCAQLPGVVLQQTTGGGGGGGGAHGGFNKGGPRERREPRA